MTGDDGETSRPASTENVDNVSSTQEPSPPIVVVIDGPAGAGKSTVARGLAKQLKWAYLDSGALYRALTFECFRRKIDVHDAAAVTAMARAVRIDLLPSGTVKVDGRDVTPQLRTGAIDKAVSIVAAIADVRSAMVENQRRFARENGRIVAEGRDMGTVIFPAARVKIYLDADPAERAKRRTKQRGEDDADVRRIQEQIERRDALDRGRAVAPLRAAVDAWRLDTTHMTLQEVSEAVLARVRSLA